MFGFGRKKATPERALKLLAAGKLDEALACADEIIAAGPGIALSHRFKGDVLFKMERYADAVGAFEQARQLGGSGTDDLHLWIAVAHASSGNKAEATRILEEHIRSPGADADSIAAARQAIEEIARM